jgi:protocatechuate 3,4-dioxygenase beta subunit
MGERVTLQKQSMENAMKISRRDVVIGVSAGAFSLRSIAGDAQLRPTPQETFGPYFPVHMPRHHDFNLAHISGRKAGALGQVIDLSGRVLRTDGTPVSGARIEIWQANAAGRYIHPIDKNPAPLDPNFEGVALLKSAVDGRYRVLTVKPGAYPDPAGGMRAPHIHFDVTSDQYRLVSQMYFPGEPLNDKDILVSTMQARHRDPALATCKSIVSDDPAVLKFEWDIVLLKV